MKQEKDEDKKYLIYMHQNKINGKRYIGQTCQSTNIRWGVDGKKYLSKTKHGTYRQPLFAKAIIKWGWDNFEHTVLYEGLSKQEADEIEIRLIAEYQSNNPDYGYNIAEGGNPDISGKKNPMYGMTVDKLTPEQRWNRGKAFRGKTRSQEYKDKMSEKAKEYYKTHDGHLKGKTRPQEFKDHMHDVMLGRIISNETKELMSKNHADVSGAKNPRARAVRCIETGEVFGAASEAGTFYGMSTTNPGVDIRNCCKGIRETACKDKITGEPLHWEWVN